MLRKENLYKITFIILIIILNLFLTFYLYLYFTSTKEVTYIDKYIGEYKEEDIKIDDYIALLEIPKINLKKGLLDINNKNNNINKNVTILPYSNYPNEDNHLIILASHSGNGIHSYFTNIDKLNIDDLVYIYYQNKKYTYNITSKYEEEKNGNISILKRNESMLVLTTCKEKDKTKQLIIEAKLIQID